MIDCKTSPTGRRPPVRITFVIFLFMLSLLALLGTGQSATDARASGLQSGDNAARPDAPQYAIGQIHTDNSTDDGTPAVAFASGSDQFLVVWENDYGGGDYDIRGRYLDIGGNPLGSEFYIASTGTPERFPDVAYDAKTGVFLVVWEYGTGAQTTKIQGQIVSDDINDTPTKIGGVLDITDGTVNAASPAIAHNETDEQYLVVYTYKNGEDVYGRRIWNSYGTPAPVDVQFPVHNFGAGDENADPDVAWGRYSDTFLVVWSWSDNGTAEGRIVARSVWDTHQTSGDQRQGTTTWILDSDAYNAGTLGSSDPAVLYDSSRDNYVIAFETNGPSGGFLDWSVYFHRAASQDPNDGSGIKLSGNTQAYADAWNPDLAEVAGTDLILLAHADVYQGGGEDVYVRSTLIHDSEIIMWRWSGPARQDTIYDVAAVTADNYTLSRVLIVDSERHGDNDIHGQILDSPCYSLTITTSPMTGGSVTALKPPNCGGPLDPGYASGSTERLSAVAADGYQFSHWSGGITGTSTQTNFFSITSNMFVTAHFEESSSETFVYLPMVVNPPGTITGFEVTQAVQDSNNSVPLVANRATMARVFTTPPGGNDIAGQSVTLTAVRNGSSLGSITLGPRMMTTSRRENYGSTYNFTLPSNWLSGNVTLTATHNGTGNSYSTTLNFVSVPALDVVLVPIRYTHTGNGVTYPAPTQDYVSDWVLRAYPISDVNVTFHSDYAFTGNLNNFASWNNLLDEMHVLKQSEAAPASTIYYAYIPFNCNWANCASSTLGLADIGVRVSAGVDATNTPATLSPGEVAGHEWGHNLGRMHAPCGNPGNVDPNWPANPIYNGAAIGQFGMDGLWTGSPVLLNPANYVDVMSYCNTEWVSDYTYTGLMQDQMASGAAVAASVEESLLISAQVVADGAVSLAPVYTLPQIPTPAEDGEYLIELLDEAGQVIATHGVDLTMAVEEESVRRSIHTAVPLPDVPVAQVRIVAAASGAVASQRSLQPNAMPATAFSDDTAPIQVDETAQTAVIQWGSPDTPALVRYTADDGQTWTTLAINVLGGELTVDLSALPGGSGRFEIFPANSGDPDRLSIDMTLDLPDAAPIAWITGPSTATANTAITFFGHASDREDGALAVTWTVDGETVTTGTALTLSELAPGTHVMKVTAIDEAGQIAEYSHTVTITPSQ